MQLEKDCIICLYMKIRKCIPIIDGKIQITDDTLLEKVIACPLQSIQLISSWEFFVSNATGKT